MDIMASLTAFRVGLAELIDPSIGQDRLTSRWASARLNEFQTQLSHRAAEANNAKYELANTKAEIAKLSAEINEVSVTSANATTKMIAAMNLLRDAEPALQDEATLVLAKLKATGRNSKARKPLEERAAFLGDVLLRLKELRSFKA